MNKQRRCGVPLRMASLLTKMAVAVSACGGSASPIPTPLPSVPPPTATAVPATMTLPATATQTAALTVTPAPTSDLPLISGPDVTFQGVQFHLPTDLANGVHAQVVPETDAMGVPYPAYVEFTLPNYNATNDLKPQINIYPVDELRDSGTQVVRKLKQLLAEKSTTVQPGAGIPILPPRHAGQLIDAQVRYLTFGNGSGIRVLTQFAQDVWPVNNEDLLYVFQGLTNDGRYYVSAFLPVRASFLPDHVDEPEAVPAVDGVSFPKFTSMSFDSEYAGYQQAITHKLDTTPPEEFSPTLSKLDELVESLLIGSADQETASVPCLNAPPTRLRVGLFAYVNPDPPLPNNVRRDPGKEKALLGEIEPGQAMKILEGPRCDDGWVWWEVRTLETELVGWTPEGDWQNYWLVPCASRSECTP